MPGTDAVDENERMPGGLRIRGSFRGLPTGTTWRDLFASADVRAGG
jgi:hypothetical protein